ncbi:hypothetical protein A8926_3791 [Saccharopolyspora spinosa]|uniref:Uncharacterized protein n=1 Tax=Saccharopolyspora spinosa TaxID=60894 RepID=A0A2N3XZ96_SACSN|nr:hypothetical protein A8926_3791 [Saccharopolyspora spinosa]
MADLRADRASFGDVLTCAVCVVVTCTQNGAAQVSRAPKRENWLSVRPPVEQVERPADQSFAGVVRSVREQEQ